jgi:hypothetical protein
MKITMTAAIALLDEIGFHTCKTWDADRLAAKLNKLNDLLDGSEKIEENAAAFKKVLAANKAEDEITVTEPEEDEAPAKSKKSRKEEPEADEADEDEKPAKAAKKAKRGATSVAAINASFDGKGNWVTFAQVKKYVQKHGFPDIKDSRIRAHLYTLTKVKMVAKHDSDKGWCLTKSL